MVDVVEVRGDKPRKRARKWLQKKQINGLATMAVVSKVFPLPLY